MPGCASIVGVVAIVGTLVVFDTAQQLLTVSALPLSTPSSQQGNLTVIADHFGWAENLIFDGLGNLFVSDFDEGIVYRLQRDASSGVVSKRKWVWGFKHVLGLSVDWRSTSANRSNDKVSVVFGKHDGTTGIADFFGGGAGSNANATNRPGSTGWTTAYTTSTIGNGLARNFADDILYTACESDFVPFLGKVFAMTKGTTHEFDHLLTASDGTFIDQERQLLYVSEVVGAFVRVYNISEGPLKHQLVTKYKAPKMLTLDDYCVVELGGKSYLIGADFSGGKVVAFDATTGSDSSAITLAEGFGGNPTSVRVGLGEGWASIAPNATIALYVSEGGPLLSATKGKGSSESKHNNKVWQLSVPLSIFS